MLDNIAPAAFAALGADGVSLPRRTATSGGVTLLSGTALEFLAALDSNCSFPYATTGMSFPGCTRNGFDLSSMKSFSLRARGNGVIRVRFETRLLDSATQSLSNYTFPIQLTDTWRSLDVPVDSLRILPAISSPGLYPWTQESRSVIDIEFEFSKTENSPGDTLRLFLDDLYLNGVGIDDLMP